MNLIIWKGQREQTSRLSRVEHFAQNLLPYLNYVMVLSGDHVEVRINTLILMKAGDLLQILNMAQISWWYVIDIFT